MAKGRIDGNQRPNTIKENKSVLFELQTRNKIEHRNTHDLNKLFTRLNSDGASKHFKNAKGLLVATQEKMSTEHMYGPIEGFPPGAWWGIRMDCSRDKVHSPFNADIQEGPFGVVSLCTSHLNLNNDVDLGDSLTFTGSKYEAGNCNEHPLVKSHSTQVPLRLVRSYNLVNEFAPKTGYRYDGLYTVAAYWIGVSSEIEKHYKFALIRIQHQEQSPWPGSVQSISKPALYMKKCNTSQTHCNSERLAIDPTKESRINPIEQETSNNLSKRSETLKFSFNKTVYANGGNTEKSQQEHKRNSNDSTIVTRCVSRKPECSSGSAMISVPYAEPPAQSTIRVRASPSKPTPCKLQNTNISIRTDLYDSSHNLQQDPKKGTPMTFCRIFKSVRGPTRVVSHSNVGTINLNCCGPCPKDKTPESLIQSRSGISKLSSNQSPSCETNRTTNSCTPKINNINLVLAESNSNIDHEIAHTPVDDSLIAEMTNTRVIDKSDMIDNQRPKVLEENQVNVKPLCVETTTKEAGNKQIICPITRRSSKETLEISNEGIKVDKSNQDEKSKEPQPALDLLAPDQMLNYIVKQKYHPTAKLLIGSVIGLATGESTILRAYESLISRNNHWNRKETIRKVTEDSPGLQKERGENKAAIELQNYDCKQETKIKDRKNDRSVAKVMSQKRVKESKDRLMFKMRLRRPRVSKCLSSVEKKSSANKPGESSSQQRLRETDPSEKSQQQPFSKSTILKNTNRAKKRRGELANLVIDAKIGPKIRGPRNRRLRCTTHIFAKKRYGSGSQDITTYLGANRTNGGIQEKKISGDVELSSRRSKRLSSAGKTRIPQSRYINPKKISQNNKRMGIERNYRGENTGKIQPSTQTNSSATSQTRSSLVSSSKGEKRKTSSTRSTSRNRSNNHEQTSGNNSKSSKKLCCRPQRDVKIQRIRLVDAATQCSARKDATTCIDPEIRQLNRSDDQENSVKVEWIDLDDVKSEIYDSDVEDRTVLEDVDVRHRNEEIQIFPDNDEQGRKRMNDVIRPQVEKPRTHIDVNTRLSAFVPVNTSESDVRIARLRSIGFRPIEPACLLANTKQSNIDPDRNSASGCSQDPIGKSMVIRRKVDEQYNKYMSEETNVVAYMDQELRYQDIEDEEIVTSRKNRLGETKIDDEKNKIKAANNQCDYSTSVEEDSEIPWHGWKKFVKNKQAHWIGW